jgi:hypothetical protein
VSGFQQRRLRCRWFFCNPLLALGASERPGDIVHKSLSLSLLFFPSVFFSFSFFFLGAHPAVESYTLHHAATKIRMWFTNDVSSYSGGPYRARCSSIGPLWSLIWRTKSRSTWGTPARYVTRTRNMPVALPSAASVFRLEKRCTRMTQDSCIKTGKHVRGVRAEGKSERHTLNASMIADTRAWGPQARYVTWNVFAAFPNALDVICLEETCTRVVQGSCVRLAHKVNKSLGHLEWVWEKMACRISKQRHRLAPGANDLYRMTNSEEYAQQYWSYSESQPVEIESRANWGSPPRYVTMCT